MSDAIVIGTDWVAIDCASRGLPEPAPEQTTFEFLSACCGGSEQMSFMSPELRAYRYENVYRIHEEIRHDLDFKIWRPKDWGEIAISHPRGDMP